jgi:TRAP-type C4-dicarboxylate transport system permease large subunit
MNFKQFFSCFMNCCTLVGRVLCSIATAGVFVYIISSMGAARKLSAMVEASGLSATGTLLICVLILFLLGMILNVNVLLMVIVPVMVPTILAMGINPLHFGIITMLVVQMGVNTPPVGSLIYLTASIADCPASEVIKESLPFIVALLVLIIVWIFCPGIITFLPNLLH